MARPVAGAYAGTLPAAAAAVAPVAAPAEAQPPHAKPKPLHAAPAPDKDKKAKSYSTGMKQRLGIAMALLNDPDILILDEPLNGLDPEGVFEMRELITELKNEGKTILLSSHILSEVQKTCTHVGILQDGQLRYQGLLSDLLNNVPLEVNIESNHTYAIEQICQEDGIEVISVVGDRISITINKSDHDGFMGRLATQGVTVLRSESVAKNLEEVYLNLIRQR